MPTYNLSVDLAPLAQALTIAGNEVALRVSQAVAATAQAGYERWTSLSCARDSRGVAAMHSGLDMRSGATLAATPSCSCHDQNLFDKPNRLRQDARTVLKTPQIADSPAPERSGFFTSIVFNGRVCG